MLGNCKLISLNLEAFCAGVWESPGSRHGAEAGPGEGGADHRAGLPEPDCWKCVEAGGMPTAADQCDEGALYGPSQIPPPLSHAVQLGIRAPLY